jgi:hypothetical protein
MKLKSSDLQRNILEIAKFINFLEGMQFFLFLSIGDDKVCLDCDKFDMGLYTRKEIERRWGDYLIKQSDTLWIPNIHPNCRCFLILWEEEMLHWTKEKWDEMIKEWLTKLDSYHVHTAQIVCHTG